AVFVDFSSRPPVVGLAANALHLGNYRRVYKRTEAEVTDHAGVDPLADYLETYRRLNATAVVLKARDLTSTFGFKISNEDVASFCDVLCDRYVGYACVDPNRCVVALRESETDVRDPGLRGLNIQCFEHKVNIDDRRLYPLYAKCAELDVPVNIHCG